MPVVKSPESNISVELSLKGDQQTIEIDSGETQLVKPSPLRLTEPFDTDTDPSSSLSIIAIDQTTTAIDRDFTTQAGKRRHHTYHATESRFTCEISNGHSLTLVIRVSNDGVAVRLCVPESSIALTFETELSLRLPRKSIAWLSPHTSGHETNIRQTTAFDAGGTFSMPGLFKIADSEYILVTEADVDSSFMPSQLRTDSRDDRIHVTHPELPVRTADRFETPWRVLTIGDLETIVESDLVPALVESPEIHRTDWIEPGRVAWSWWSEWDSTTQPERQKDYIEYASDRGWEYILIDEGWSADWIPDVVEYAHDRGVGVFLWTHWTDVFNPAEREEKLTRWSEWGIDGIKVDVMDSNEQDRMQFYEQLMESTAEHRLMVNFHSSLLPTGMKVRWPHVLTYEAVKGAEHYEWSTVTPTHNTVLPYTRNVVGPMDYTPVTFSSENRHTTVGHELALSVVYESGLQHFADSIDEYRARPHAEWFLERVPATWDEIRFLDGQPGTGITLARRNGDDWYVGAITAGPERSLSVPVSFLPEPRSGTLIRDDARGETLVKESVSISVAQSELSVDVPANGGFVLYLSG